MKTSITSQLVSKQALVMLAAIIGFVLSSSAKQKHALLVGISHYPSVSGWNPTSGVNDVKALEYSLRNEQFQHVDKLLDAEATKQATLDQLEAIVKRVEKGDVVLFYFSGHGQLVRDFDADEYDGYDEALVMYGAPKTYQSLYKNEHHLLDEEISVVFNKIRRKIGDKGELIVLIETGFGWNPDGDAPDHVKGGALPLQRIKSMVAIEQMGLYEIGIVDDLPYGLPSDEYGQIIHISATAINQMAQEYEGTGVFTLSLCRALENKSDSTTYYDFFVQLVNQARELHSDQIPKLEGYSDEIMFSSRIDSTDIRNENYRDIHERIIAKLDSSELQILFNLKYREEQVIKNEVGRSDWEKSFFDWK